MLAVVDDIGARWEADLRAVTKQDDTHGRLRAYIDFAFSQDFDPSDLALFADVRLRQELRDQWMQRLRPWLGPAASDEQRHPQLVAARLIADGAWFAQALEMDVLQDDAERASVHQIAVSLLGSDQLGSDQYVPEQYESISSGQDSHEDQNTSDTQEMGAP